VLAATIAVCHYVFRHAPPAGEDAPPAPPWGGSTLQAFLEAGGARAVENPGVRSVYLADTPRTCFAERMFYFHDQSRNIDSITPNGVEFRMMTPAGVPFAGHAADQLDYLGGEVRVVTPSGATPLPAAIATFSTWQRVGFNH
jgi:hypothetical protein